MIPETGHVGVGVGHRRWELPRLIKTHFMYYTQSLCCTRSRSMGHAMRTHQGFIKAFSMLQHAHSNTRVWVKHITCASCAPLVTPYDAQA